MVMGDNNKRYVVVIIYFLEVSFVNFILFLYLKFIINKFTFLLIIQKLDLESNYLKKYFLIFFSFFII